MMLLTVDGGFTFYLNGKPVFQSIGVPDDWKLVKQIDLTHDLLPGNNTIGVSAINEQVNGNDTPAGVIGKLIVELEGEKPVVIVTDKQWKASDKKEDGWEKPAFE